MFSAFLALLNVIILGFVIIQLSNTIDRLRSQIRGLNSELKLMRQSRNNMDDMLESSLNLSMQLMNFIGKFKSQMTADEISIIDKWKIQISQVKEVYIERWKSLRENGKTASTNDTEPEDSSSK